MPSPTRIRCRADLMQYVLKHSPVSAVRKAMIYGQQELLGWFKQLPPHGQAGWVIRVRSEHGRTWLVTVEPKGCELCTRVLHEDMPLQWKWWAGWQHHPTMQHYHGDDPFEAKRLRDEEAVEKPVMRVAGPTGGGAQVPGTLRIGDDEGTVKL